jgi:ABC-type uncharacterized transport system substrate-binding protein
MQARKFSGTGDSDITRQSPDMSFRLTVLLGIVFLSGCSSIQQAQDQHEISVSNIPVTVPVLEQPVDSPPVPTPGPAPVHGRVLILLSDDVPSYAAIAEKISQRGPQHDYLTVNLDRNPSLSAKLFKEVETFNPDRIVAIGLNAAKAGQALNDIPMVFCQIFNFEDHELLSPTSTGVKLLPPFSLQFELWKDLSPELRTAGIILGAGQESLVEEIRNAAAEHNVEVLTRTVNSDKESLFAFKRLAPKIQGFLLLPDNRVLSPRVLRDIVTYSRKHGTQIVVFNPKLLTLGADISFTSTNDDIADTVLRIIDASSEQMTNRPSRMTSLTTLRADISPEVAKQLSAPTTEKLARYLGSE